MNCFLKQVYTLEGFCETHTDSETSVCSTDEDIPNTSRSELKSDSVPLNVPRRIIFSPSVILAADRHKISSNALNDIVAALIRESNGNVDDFVLSKTSTLRARKKQRSEQFQLIKAKFQNLPNVEFLTVHWDEKMLKESLSYQQSEHIAILASQGKEVKLLGTMNLESGAGLVQANAVNSMLEEWEVQEKQLQCVLIPQQPTQENFRVLVSYWSHCLVILCSGLLVDITCLR